MFRLVDTMPFVYFAGQTICRNTTDNLHPKPLHIESDLVRLPLYMAHLL